MFMNPTRARGHDGLTDGLSVVMRLVLDFETVGDIYIIDLVKYKANLDQTGKDLWRISSCIVLKCLNISLTSFLCRSA